jgi:hypothetical protein
MCSRDFKSVEINDDALITCNYELCAEVANKSNTESKSPLKVTQRRVNIMVLN